LNTLALRSFSISSVPPKGATTSTIQSLNRSVRI
jgi:hypothetical protein